MANEFKVKNGLITQKIKPLSDSTTALQVNNAGDTTTLINVDTTNNRIGIGKTAPGYSLDVNSTFNAINIYENGTLLTSKYLQLSGGTLTGGLTGSTAYFTNTTINGSLSISGVITSTNTTSALRVYAYDTDTNIWRVNGSAGTGDSGDYGFNLRYLGTLGGNDNALALYADNQTGAQIETYRVRQDGKISFLQNVAIGTTASPTKTLDVTGAIRTSNGQFYSNATLSFYNDSNGAQLVRTGGILVGSSYDTDPLSGEIRTSNNQNLTLNARGTGNLYLQTADSTKVTLLNNGNVGIGTNSPGVKLDVNGLTRFRDSAGIDGNKYLFFGREEIFGGTDVGGADYGYIIHDTNNSIYGTGQGETSALVIGTSNDADGSAGDHMALVPTANLYLNPGSDLRKGTLANYSNIWHGANFQSFNSWTPNFVGVQSRGAGVFVKTLDTAGWNSQVYSSEGYITNVIAQASFGQNSAAVMFGLNSDPTTNPDYNSLDFSWFGAGDTTAQIYENGSYVGNYGAYTASDVFSITYDGSNVRYYKNNELIRTVARTIGSKLHFDSSFHNTGNSLTNVGFGSYGNMLQTGGGLTTGMLSVSTNLSLNEDWENSPISIRERGLVGSSQSDNKYSPNLNFHWVGFSSNSLWMGSDGVLHWGEYSGAGVPGNGGTLTTGYINALNNVGIGTTNPGSYKLNVNGDTWLGGEVNIPSTYSLHFSEYGGGWFMQDTSWIRTRSGKSVWTGGGILGSDGGLTVGYGGYTSPSGGAIISGNVGIGTTNPSAKLEVSGSIRVNSGIYSSKTSANSPVEVYSVAYTGNTCMIVDYTVVNVAGTAQRSGTLTCNFNSSAITHTETATPDLGSSTSAVTFTTAVSSGAARVYANITGTDTWTIKVSARYF